MGIKDQGFHNKVIRAWNKVYKRKAERKNAIAKEPYTKWVQDRVWIIKLSFEKDLEYKSEVPEIRPISLEEVDNLKNALKQAQKGKKQLEINLLNLTKETNHMQLILESKDKKIDKSQKELEK